MEKTIFTLKRIIEKLQAENKRLKFNSKKSHFLVNQVNYTIFSLILYDIFVFLYIIIYTLSNIGKNKCYRRRYFTSKTI